MDNTSIYILDKKYDLSFAGDCFNRNFRPCVQYGVYKRNKFIGSIEVRTSHLTVTGWKRNSPIYFEETGFVDFVNELLPALNVPIDLLELTENEAFYFIIYLGYETTSWDKKNKMFHVKCQNTLEETIAEYVYDDEITEEKVQKHILDKLYQLKKEKKSPIPIDNFFKRMYVDRETFDLNIQHLEGPQYIQVYNMASSPSVNMVVYMTTKGMAYYNNKFLTTSNNPITTTIKHEYYGPVHNISAHDQSTVLSEVNISVVTNHFEQLKDLIKKDYHEKDQEEALKEIDAISEKSKDPNKIKEAIQNSASLLQKYANYVQITTFIIQYILPLLNVIFVKEVR